ncbi:MAG: ATP-binding cassette domain-containing protein [Acidimicrobiia bacterium]
MAQGAARRLLAIALAATALSVLLAPAAQAADSTAKSSALTDVREKNGLGGGGGHGLAIKTDGSLWSWGYNAYGQLGIDQAKVLVPTQVPGLTDVAAVTGGEFHTLAIKNGSVWAWGNNDDGQLGQGRSGGTSTKPLQVPDLSGVTAVSASGSRSFAIKNRTLYAWGDNEGGKLGIGSSTVKVTSPTRVPGLSDVVAVATGGGGRSDAAHTLALTGDGTVYSWGTNEHGQLGNGESCTGLDTSKCNQSTPKPVPGLPSGRGGVTVKDIAAAQGGDYSMVRLSNGKVMTWGDNERGQLGQGEKTTTGCKCISKPGEVRGLDGTQAISASGGAGVALKDGTVFVWGDNTFGQLGNGSGPDSANAGPVKGLSGITSIASGGGFILARKQNGDAVGWGINDFGEVGIGNTDASVKHPVPIGVPLASNPASFLDSNTALLLLLVGALVIIGVVFLRRRRRPLMAGPSGGYPARPRSRGAAAGGPSGGYGTGWQPGSGTMTYSPSAGRGGVLTPQPPDLDSAWEEYGRRIRLLSRVDLFVSASHEVLAELARALRPLPVHKGDIVVREGDVGDEFYLIETGTLAITTEVGGRPREVARLGPGEFFGESALLGEGRRTATVIAVSETELWALSASTFQALLRERPEIAALLRRTATQRGRTDQVFEVEEHDLDVLAKGRPRIGIGRSPENEVVFNSPLVSGHHAVIESTAGGGFRLHDLGSLNGSYVNRVRVRTADLNDGDEIWIADQHFVFDRRAIRRLIEPEGIRLDAIGLSTELKDGKRLLDNIDLSILPGEFVAIVGGSGAGKTTLLQALSGVRPPTSGQVLYSGRDYYRNLEWFRNQLGYVPQDDIIHSTLPLGVTMRYSARLRLPSDTTREQLDATMNQTLQELGLAEHVNTKVGDLSGGQRKRCSIGVELLTEPRIFLLDEPTSGLDPYTDGQMMTLLRGLADKGSTVMLTTHATQNVMLCDKVVFLARGGQLAFVGTPQRALRYFEADAFDEIYRRLVEEATPEEWSQRFRASEDYRQLMSEQLAFDPAEAEAGRSFSETRVPGGFRRFRHQFPILSKRNADLYTKNPKLLPSLVMPPILFTLLALTLFRAGAFGSTPNSPSALQILFLIAFSAFIFGLLFGVQSIVSEFPIFQRERMVNLGIAPYVLSKLTFFAPVLTVLLILMITVLRFTGRLPDADLSVYWQLTLTIVLTGLVGLALALLTSALVSNSQQATDMLSVWIMPQVLFAGALLAVPAMNFVGRMISAICPVRWSFEALGNIASLGDVFRTDTSKIGPGLAIQYGNSFSRDPIENWIILGLFVVVPLALTCLVLDRKTTTRWRPGPPAPPVARSDHDPANPVVAVR